MTIPWLTAWMSLGGVSTPTAPPSSHTCPRTVEVSVCDDEHAARARTATNDAATCAKGRGVLTLLGLRMPPFGSEGCLCSCRRWPGGADIDAPTYRDLCLPRPERDRPVRRTYNDDYRARRWHGAQPCWSGSWSAAIDGHFKSSAYLTHPLVGQAAEPLDQETHRHALDGVQVDGAAARYWVVVRLEHHFAGQPSDRGRTRPDQRPSQPRDRGVARQNRYGATPDVGQLAPPHLAPPWELAHDAAAASRNDARSPHASVSSSGCSS